VIELRGIPTTSNNPVIMGPAATFCATLSQLFSSTA
jgi:hypothetical protein